MRLSDLLRRNKIYKFTYIVEPNNFINFHNTIFQFFICTDTSLNVFTTCVSVYLYEWTGLQHVSSDYKSRVQLEFHDSTSWELVGNSCRLTRRPLSIQSHCFPLFFVNRNAVTKCHSC